MGSHYGVKIRKQENKIKTAQKLRHACPSCGKAKVKRTSTALFECASCGTVFAGGTYVPRTNVGITAAKLQSSKNVQAKEE
ncbi:MAG: 50S ribosomal protein L37ae [Candidatus Micrarchaeia archaeon]|jgi:large subunit ribosomal protein L37Ae